MRDKYVTAYKSVKYEMSSQSLRNLSKKTLETYKKKRRNYFYYYSNNLRDKNICKLNSIKLALSLNRKSRNYKFLNWKIFMRDKY